MRLNITKIKALFFLLLYWIVLNYLVLHAPLRFFKAPQPEAIKEVKFVKSDESSQEALPNNDWKKQSLPDVWYENHNHVEQIWYRTEVEFRALFQSVWAVYLPSVSHNAEVFINGVWIGQGGAFTDPVSRHHNEPLLFSFSPQLLHTGLNQIDIRVATAFHDQGLLGQFYIAPKELLIPAYQFKYFVRVELIKWITTSLYAISLIVFSFWLARPQDSIYMIFALELFFWATHNLNLFVESIPFSTQLWEALMMVTFGWLIISLVFFNHRYAGMLNKKIEKLMLFFGVLSLGLFLLPDTESVLLVGFKIWDSILVLFGVYALIHLIRVYWHKPHIDVFLMMLVGVPILVFGLHDYLMLNNYGNRLDGLVMQYSVIPTVLLFSWFLVRRFVQSINKAEALAENLEQRVEENKAEIYNQYEKLRVFEKQSVLSEERERIMRDMHDGIGGQLVSVISMLQEQKGDIFNKTKQKIQYSLTDLRLVIDSLDPAQNELPIMLGMMRLRLNDQLEAAKIKLEWAVTDLPEIADMSPRQSLHIMRIVQEAITNSIKHAKTSNIKLATGVLHEKGSCPQVYIDIIDYGSGLQSDKIAGKANKGRGVENMHYRAEQMNAKLLMESSAEGTTIRLLLAIA